MSRYLPPRDRAAAIELVLAAFDTAGPHRVNTPPAVTSAQGVASLLALGVTSQEVQVALLTTRLPVLEWCGTDHGHAPHLCRGSLCMGEGMPELRPDGHVLVAHAPGHHTGEDDGQHCMFCEGGLRACTRCNAFEGAWPDGCPGEAMTDYQADGVYAGSLNFRDGVWRAECCRARRPAAEVLAEDGYRQGDDGRWVKP